MSLETRTYAELLDQISGLVGTELTSNQLTRARSNVNLAAKRAYDRSKWWERFLVVAEPRTVSRGYVDFEEDSFNVYGAGTDGVNGLYVRNGTANSRARYSKYQAGSTTLIDWDIEWDNSSDWEILVGANNSTLTENLLYYTITDASATPPLVGWTTATDGTAPSPLLEDVSKIKTFLSINPTDPYSGSWTDQLEFVASARGAYLTYVQDYDTVYVTYKKALSDRYGDGTGGTVSDIPEEWFYYIALYAARQHQIAEQVGDMTAVLASREVDEALLDELEKLENQRTAAALDINRSTYRSRDYSL